MIETSVLLKGSLSEAYQVFVTKPVHIFPLSLRWLTDPNRKLPEQQPATTIKPLENGKSEDTPPPAKKKNQQNSTWNPKKKLDLISGSTGINWIQLGIPLPEKFSNWIHQPPTGFFGTYQFTSFGNPSLPKKGQFPPWMDPIIGATEPRYGAQPAAVQVLRDGFFFREAWGGWWIFWKTSLEEQNIKWG